MAKKNTPGGGNRAKQFFKNRYSGIQRKDTVNNQARVKDFILLRDEFILQAQKKIAQTLILHSKE